MTLSPDTDAARMQHFHSLDREQQGEAIRRLAYVGLSEHGIANATRLSVEQVRRCLADRETV